MAPYINIVLILWMITPETKSDMNTLLNRLKSKSWPWFGDSYPMMCSTSKDNWPACYNPRSFSIDSILERVGLLDDIQLTLEIRVVFSAPADNIDVCGKMTHFEEVKPFELNNNGYIINELLKRGAEIYRKFPTISWTGTKDEIYELIFIDTGLVKVYSYVHTIHKTEGRFIGKVLWPYRAPANPSSQINPILIVLTKQAPNGPMPMDDLVKSGCVDDGLSAERADTCRQHLTMYFKDATVKGMQVFYTDGSSKYEQYRACNKNLFCSDKCIEKINNYVISKKSLITFMDFEPLSLDMYVNLQFTSPVVLSYTVCCKKFEILPYSFRAVPGDDLQVSDTFKVHVHQGTTLDVILCGGAAMASDQSTIYSVLMVDTDAPAFTSGRKQLYGHMWVANLIYQEPNRLSGKKILVNYTGPTPPDQDIHKYYILLFSHKTPIDTLPNGFYGQDCEKRCFWNLKKLPSDFTLRAINWFSASRDDYAVSKLMDAKGSKMTCRNDNSEYQLTCVQQYVDVRSATTVDILVSSSKKISAEKFSDPMITNSMPMATTMAATTSSSGDAPDISSGIILAIMSMYVSLAGV